jgi:hypothetical protein
LAAVSQVLRLGEIECVLKGIPSRANLADSITKDAQNDLPTKSSEDYMNEPLLDALGTNYANLRGFQQLTLNQEDVSR